MSRGQFFQPIPLLSNRNLLKNIDCFWESLLARLLFFLVNIQSFFRFFLNSESIYKIHLSLMERKKTGETENSKVAKADEFVFETVIPEALHKFIKRKLSANALDELLVAA